MVSRDFPKNELEFHERFSNEEACRQYLSDLRWPKGFICPHCGHKAGWRRSNRDEWICASATCGKETSLRAGTVLHNSRKPLKAWLLAMFHMTVNKQGMSALRLQRVLGFGSYETALRWLRELRRVMSTAATAEKLGPEVEVDEKVLGGVEKGGKGPFVGKTWIVGAVEKNGRGCGRARLQVIGSDRTAPMLCGFVEAVVEKGSLVSTDGLQGYVPLTDLGYRHDPRTTTDGRGKQLRLDDGRHASEIHLPRIHRVFSLIERIVNGCMQGSFSERHLQSYLDEYCFRFNRRRTTTPLGIFQELASRIVRSKAVPLWSSSGRLAPKIPTRVHSTEWQTLGASLRECAYSG